MGDQEHSLATYVSDMLALEEHIRIPLTAQAEDKDFAQYFNAATLVARISALCELHIETLKSSLESLGGHELSATKTVVTNIEGWFAGAIDKIRKTKVAKALRDDYTALALCSVSYSMLLSTANAFGDARVSELAQRHLRDYAQAIMEIGDIMPDVVVQDLRLTGLEVQAGTIDLSRSQIADSWRSGAQAQRQIHTGTIESEAALNRDAERPYPTA